MDFQINNFKDLFQNMSTNFFCPSCGKKYNGSEEHELHKTSEGFALSISCSHCKLPVMVNVINQNFNNINDEPCEIEAITTNEVVDFHNYISKFDGDFCRIFR